mgnify:CR=1 FL=1
MKAKILTSLFLISTLLLQSCISDLRSKSLKQEGLTTENELKGKEMLESAWKKQGYQNLSKHRVYTFHGNDTWKGMLGKVGNIWPQMKSELQFKYKIGTFDGQVQFLDGKRKGDISGLQNWNYYEIPNQQEPTFSEENKRITFGIAAIQYFTEMIDRIKNAPIISYAGEGELRGKKYDLVFCTWHTEEPTDEADQYIAWINKETGLMEFTQYTIRENYLKTPGYKMVYGGVEFGNFKMVEDVLIAHEHTVFTFDLKEKKKKNLHQLIISDFTFDAFESSELILDASIPMGGNFK